MLAFDVWIQKPFTSFICSKLRLNSEDAKPLKKTLSTLLTLTFFFFAVSLLLLLNAAEPFTLSMLTYIEYN